MNLRQKRDIRRLTRQIIQIIFFLWMPALYTSAFSGVRYVIEQIRADTRQNEIIQALGSNFKSVYYVDVDHDKVYAYKVNSAVRSVLNDTLKAIPGYEAIMAEYVGKVVLTEDRETMLYETSIENLRKQLSLKKAYQYDYRIVRDGKVKYCRAKFVNTSDGGQLHRMVAGFSDISSEKQRELERRHMWTV